MIHHDFTRMEPCDVRNFNSTRVMLPPVLPVTQEASYIDGGRMSARRSCKIVQYTSNVHIGVIPHMGTRGHTARDHTARDHNARDHSARDHTAHTARTHRTYTPHVTTPHVNTRT